MIRFVSKFYGASASGAAPREEASCRFVSSRGILKSCDLHPAQPVSSSGKIPLGMKLAISGRFSELYLNTEMVPKFIRRYLYRVRHPFTLVTGDSDRAVSPRDIPEHLLNRLLENPFLVSWYAQNRVFTHEKLKSIPIGLDYHTISNSNAEACRNPHPWGHALSSTDQERQIRAIGRNSMGFAGKKCLAFSNWHLQTDRGNRKTCRERTDPAAVYYQSSFLPREESWRLNSEYAFTLSPFGFGLDCHRTWEALLLGSAPIVFRSSLDELYDGLPVVIVDNWAEVTPQRLAQEQQRIAAQTFKFCRLDLAYWVAKIRRQHYQEASSVSFDSFLALHENCA